MATTTKIYSDISGTTAASSGSEIRNVQDHSKFNKDLTSTGTSPTFYVDSNGNGSAQFETDASITQAGSFTGNALVVGQNKSIYFENISDSDLTIGMEGNLTNEKGLNEVGNILSVATTDKDLTSDERRSIVNYFSRKGGSQTEIYDYQAYDVNSKTPTVSLDFTGNGFYRNLPYYFRLGDTYASFADTFMGNSPKLTYGANSNSTMTQGYGPELFEFGSWTAGTGWSVVGETLVGDNATGNIDIPFDTEARVLVVTYTIEDGVSGGVRFRFTGTANNNGIIRSSSGTFTEIIDTTQNSILRFVHAGSGFTGTISNISVREAPKIVWAPHNLLDYSEDFSQWSALGIGNGTAPVLVSSNNVAPDGTNTATRFQFDLNGETTGTHLSTIQRSVTPNTAGVDHTFRLWVKSTDGTSTYNMIIANQLTAPITVDGTWRPVEFEFAVTGQLTPGIYIRSGRTPVNSDTADILVWGAHYHRSDLGGMAQVPGAATGFEYYVPTNGSAEYLPRVGHHVYNGSTWVNEGLLIESEARTNLLTHSEDFSQWSPVSVSLGGLTTGPSGSADATPLVANTSNNQHRLDFTTTSTAADHTFSVYAKSSGYSGIWIRLGALTAQFDLAAETIPSHGGTTTANIEDAGNGWYRVSISGTAAANDIARINVIPTGAVSSDFAGDGTSGILIYGAQLEQGSTPSSYMPTNGQPGGAPRTAQSLTVPAHWYDADNPTYTGPELVDNNDFSNGTTGWAGNNATLSLSSGRLRVTDNGSSAYAYQVLTVEPGKTYKLTFDYLFPSANTATDYEVNIRNTNQSGSILEGLNTGTTTWVEDVLSSNSLVFTPNTSTVGLTLASPSTTGDYADFGNVSVRQVSTPQFGWPTPEYIGPDLVVEGNHTQLQSDWSYANGVYTSSGAQTASQNIIRFDNIGIEEGKVYSVSCDIANLTAGNVGVKLNGGSSVDFSTNGTHTATFVGLNLDGFQVLEQNGFNGDVSNISVREINPLSVSLQMDGRMTYADEGVSAQQSFYRWRLDVGNRINTDLYTNSTNEGTILFDQFPSSGTVPSSGEVLTPGILTPFSIASRHGSNFIRGATDGVMTSLNDTPTALPDLSGTDLEIAYDFMGTIGQFRQFAGDIGDTGLATSTEPSTEPTLSLTFDTTGGSFYNLSWSE